MPDSRVQLDLPEQSMRRLTALKEKTGAATYADVFQNALRLYEAMIDDAVAGSTFLVHRKDGRTDEYDIFR